MTPFALPYNPDASPVVDLIGVGFRPAWQPADFIGPRLDCAMWVEAPDADTAYLAKYDGPIDPYAHLAGYEGPLGGYVGDISACSSLAITGCGGRVFVDTSVPPASPVPVPASAVLLIVAIAILGIAKRGRV